MRSRRDALVTKCAALGARVHHVALIGATLAVGLVLPPSAMAARASGAEVVDRQSAQGGRPCPLYEAEVPGVPSVANPFDPDQVEVTVEFTGPGGERATTRAYATLDHERALVDGQEQLTPEGDLHWVVRFRPPVPGEWRWRATIDAGGASTTTDPMTFSCEADSRSHGVPRVSTVDAHTLAYADGTGFVPLGENLSWYGAGGTYDYDRWLDRLAAHGATWIRVWMPSWAMGIEWNDTSLGDYRNRLDRAWQLDHVMAAAQERGIVVQLVLLNHGAFSLSTNSEWADNPYNEANGGPLSDPTDFFTDTTARDLFERRLRYITARWGAFPNLIWELWNEVDATGGEPAEVVAWHERMASTIDRLDQGDHLVTTSISAFTDFVETAPRWAEMWRLRGLDLVQVHIYGIGDSLALNLVPLAAAVLGRAREYGKPVALAEVGVDFRGPVETQQSDPTHEGFHEGAWAGLFLGGVGAGMPWWWDLLVDPEDLYGLLLDGLGAMLEGVEVATERFALGGATSEAPEVGELEAYALRGRTTALVWLRNPSDWWNNPDDRPISRARITLTGLRAGAWATTLVDPHTGATRPGPRVTSDGSTATMTVTDAFAAELGLRLSRTGGAPPDVPTTPPAVPVDAPATFTG